MVIAMRTKGNAITEITKHQQFTVNVPEKDLTKESEIAGFNSRKDKFALTGLSYTIGETVDAPLVDQCPVSIECQVLDMVECGALTNVIARVTRRVVDEELIDENDAFRSDRFSPISYMGDGDGRLYRYFSDESVKMALLSKKSENKKKNKETAEIFRSQRFSFYHKLSSRPNFSRKRPCSSWICGVGVLMPMTSSIISGWTSRTS